MENNFFLVCAFALVFFLGFVIGTIAVHREMDNLEEDIAATNQQKKIKEFKLTVVDSIPPPPPPDPNEDPVTRADRERSERLQREEAGRR